MALTNAERQQRWRVRKVVVLTDEIEDIANKLIFGLERRKLRTLVTRINKHLRAMRGKRKDEAASEAFFMQNERSYLKHWLAEGRSLADWQAGLNDQDGEVWQWRRAKAGAAIAAEEAAWLRDHPDSPLPEHLCSLSDAEGKTYADWSAKYYLRLSRKRRRAP
jgi:hypothetical protein